VKQLAFEFVAVAGALAVLNWVASQVLSPLPPMGASGVLANTLVALSSFAACAAVLLVLRGHRFGGGVVVASVVVALLTSVMALGVTLGLSVLPWALPALFELQTSGRLYRVLMGFLLALFLVGLAWSADAVMSRPSNKRIEQNARR